MLENGFVLLADGNFDLHKLADDLSAHWQINISDVTEQEDAITFSVGEFLCALTPIPCPIPNEEAQQRAQGNYYCPDAIEIAKKHKQHIIVAVMNETKGTEIEGMKLYSKIIDSCLVQNSAIGVYTSGTVFSADFYHHNCIQYLDGEMIPVMLWIFIGIGQNEQGNQLYTVGMEKFAKKEMEILNSNVDMRTLHTSLMSMCSYIITANLTLQDGETIGFSAEQKWAIKLSKSVYAPSEDSLKISIV